MARAAQAGAGRRVRLDVRTNPVLVRATPRVTEVCLRFGVPMVLPGRPIAERLELDLSPGTVTLIAGPSGSGKTLLLNAIAAALPASRLVSDLPFPEDVAVVDAVAPAQSVYDAAKVLTACGLGEPMLWIRRFHQLSDGERFRARLARAVSLHRRRGGWPLLCDEFGAVLHGRLVRAIAHNLRKLATREGLALVLATSAEGLERDLRPDTVVRLGGDVPVVEGRARLVAPATGERRARICAAGASRAAGGFSLRRGLRIARGSVRDYARFAGMHYRRRDELGFVERVFVLREQRSAEALGIVVYGMPALELRLRNEATGGRFVRNARRLNREVRVLKRLVIHPDVRGCGLGHFLVRRTLRRAGVRFVECLAAMGAVNPVFEKAGMRRIGTVEPPAERGAWLRRLTAAGADPLAADFVGQTCRRPAVRRIVSAAVRQWYRAMTRGAEDRVERQSPAVLAETYRQLAGSQPVYFLWSRDRRGRALLERRAGERVAA